MLKLILLILLLFFISSSFVLLLLSGYSNDFIIYQNEKGKFQSGLFMSCVYVNLNLDDNENKIKNDYCNDKLVYLEKGK